MSRDWTKEKGHVVYDEDKDEDEDEGENDVLLNPP